MQFGRLRPAIVGGDASVDLLGAGLAVNHVHIEVPAAVEDAGVEQVERRAVAVATGVLVDQPFIRIRGLRILVEVSQTAVTRGGVEVEVVLLDVLAAVALRAGQPERALLEERITSVPQRQSQAQELVLVGNAAEAVLAPAIGARAGLVVRQEIPGIAVGAVILAHRTPGPFREIGAPEAPILLADAVIFESLAFRIEGSAIAHLLLLLVDHRRENCGNSETCEVSPHDPHGLTLPDYAVHSHYRRLPCPSEISKRDGVDSDRVSNAARAA